ncbi:MAG: hypothetical protein Q9192_001884 [Flavoplaca navasiana]
MEHKAIGQLAADILHECSWMERECRAKNIASPMLEAGTSTAFWSDTSTEITAARANALGLLDRLSALLRGPHEFLHEFVASNWDHAALYAFLQSQSLEHIASSGGVASLSNLSKISGIPGDKLVRILALLRCKNIVQEPEHGVFALTAISEELIKDGDFRAWVEFQLFETRVASAHLGEALIHKPNEYANGTSGFERGRDSFTHMLKAIALDPADSLIKAWLQRNPPANRTKVVEIGGRYGFASVSMVDEKTQLSFEVRCDSQDFLRGGEALVGLESKARITFTYVPCLFGPLPSGDSITVLVYLIRNLFWNWADADAVRLLQTLLPTLRTSPSTRILVTDGMSPSAKEFPPHVEIAYRRRDITTMTMHNVKQRTQVEWLAMFAQVDPALKIATHFETSSHVYKGLWELGLEV